MKNRQGIWMVREASAKETRQDTMARNGNINNCCQSVAALRRSMPAKVQAHPGAPRSTRTATAGVLMRLGITLGINERMVQANRPAHQLGSRLEFVTVGTTRGRPPKKCCHHNGVPTNRSLSKGCMPFKSTKPPLPDTERRLSRSCLMKSAIK